MNNAKSWKSYEDFLRYGALDRYAKLFARYELFKMIVDVPGDIAECGVFQGAGAFYWARLIQIFNPISQRKVVGFDTFEGYPDSMKGKFDKKASDRFLERSNVNQMSPEEIMEAAASLKIDHRLELVKGDATVSVKDYVNKNPGFRVALINLDFDIYEPTLAALENLFPLLLPRGIIAFDEYAINEWEESNAVDEYFKGKNVVYKTFPWGFSPTAYLIKPY